MQNNIYQSARESSGYTQEKAAEHLDLSVESLRAYETDRRIPSNRIVAKMVDIYATKYLAYQHLKNTELGDSIPSINITNLPMAVLKVQKEINDFLKCREDLIEITCDGVIDEDEKKRWNEIMKEMDDVMDAMMSIKFAE